MSRARPRLFDLADMVRKGDDTVVVLEQRGHDEGIALVREARLNYLEDHMEHTGKTPEKAFRLAGSMSTDLSEEELLALLEDLRHAWTPAQPGAARRRRK